MSALVERRHRMLIADRLDELAVEHDRLFAAGAEACSDAEVAVAAEWYGGLNAELLREAALELRSA